MSKPNPNHFAHPDDYSRAMIKWEKVQAMSTEDAGTPRTDAVEKFGNESDSCDFVRVEFARTLERELAAANERIATLDHKSP